jgi:hypothetical protein
MRGPRATGLAVIYVPMCVRYTQSCINRKHMQNFMVTGFTKLAAGGCRLSSCLANSMRWV